MNRRQSIGAFARINRVVAAAAVNNKIISAHVDAVIAAVGVQRGACTVKPDEIVRRLSGITFACFAGDILWIAYASHP